MPLQMQLEYKVLIIIFEILLGNSSKSYLLISLFEKRTAQTEVFRVF